MANTGRPALLAFLTTVAIPALAHWINVELGCQLVETVERILNLQYRGLAIARFMANLATY